MAEIKIEKKKPVWPWVLLVLIILGIIAFWYYNEQSNQDYNDDDDTSNKIENTNNNSYNDNSTKKDVETYDDGSASMMALMTAMKDSSKFGTDSTFTKTALNNLAKITVAKAKSFNVANTTSLTDLEQFAYANESDMNGNQVTDKMEMSKHFKSVGDQIVTVIQDIQTKSFPNMQKQMSDLKSTSSKLNATVDLSKQQTNVQSFFRQAHDLLHNMNS